MAAPHVTGVAGLMWSVNDKLTSSEVKQILMDTADRRLTHEGREYKVLNAKAAVEEAKHRWDADDDGIPNDADNCPGTYNPEQAEVCFP